MAYKFQLGNAQLSGTVVQEGAIKVHNESGTQVGILQQDGIVSGSGALQGASAAILGTIDGAADGSSVLLTANGATVINANRSAVLAGIDNNSGGITNAGAIAGATTISGSGAISGPALTLGGGTWTEAGVLSPDGAISAGGSVTAVGSFIIGSADMNEADLEKLDGITNGTAAASKAVVLDASKNIGTIGELSASVLSGSEVHVALDNLHINGTAVTSTAGELNILDGVTATAAELNYNDIASLGTGAASKAVVFDADGQFDGASAGLILSSSAISGTVVNVPYSGLEINGVAVSSTAAELNILDGVTATAAELNYNDIASLGTGVASKALVFDADGQFDGVTNGLILSASVFSGSGAGLTNIDVTNLDAAGSNTQIQFNDNGEFAGSDMFALATGSTGTEPKLMISGSYDGSQASSIFFGLRNVGEFSVGVDDGTAEIATPHYGITISGSEAGGITLQGGGNKGVLVDSALGIRGMNAAGDGSVWSLLRTGVISGSGALQGASLDVDSVTVITAAQQLQNIASLDATTEATVEAAIDTLANLASAGATGVDLDILGPLDVQEGIKQNGSEILSDAGALGGLTTISGSGALSAASLVLDSVAVSSTAAELNYVDIASLGTGAVSKAVVFDSDGQYDGATNGLILSASILSGSGIHVALEELHINGTAVTSTADELNILDGVTATAAELNYVDVTPGTAAASKALVLDASSRIVSGVSQITASYFSGDGSGLTNITLANTDAAGSDTQIQFNQNGEFAANANLTYDGSGSLSGSGAIKAPNLVLGGGTWTEAGVLSPDGAISAGGSITAVGSFIIGSADMNEADLEKLDGITNGTAAASKAVVLDASKNIGTIGELSASVLSGSEVHVALDNLHINGTAVTSTAGELNILDGVTATAAELNYNDIAALGTGAVSKAVVFDADGQFDGASAGLILSSSAISGTVVNVPYSGLEINGTAVSSTAAELNILDGVTATAAELNYNDIASLGTGVASKALVFDASGQFDGTTNGLILSASYFKGDGSALTGLTADPAGSDKYVQFNQTDDLAGDAGFQYNGTGSFVIGEGKSLGPSNTGMMSRFTASADSGAGVFGGFYLGGGSFATSDSSRLLRGNFGGGVVTSLVDEVGTVYLSGSDGVNVDSEFVVNSSATINSDALTVNAGLNVNNTTTNFNSDINVNSTSSFGGPATFNNHAATMNRGAVIGGEASHSLTVNCSASFNNRVDFGAAVSGSSYLQIAGYGEFFGNLVSTNTSNLGNGSENWGTGWINVVTASTGVKAGTLETTGTTTLGGALVADSLGSATVALSSDLMIIDDGATGTIKTTSLANYSTAIINNSTSGLSASAGVLGLSLFKLGDGTLDVANDKFAFMDATDNVTYQKTFASLASAMAGGGITATNGVLSTDIAAVAVVADGGTLAEGYNYFADLGSSAGVTLPAAPSVGDVVHVKAAGLSAGVTITINRAGAQVIDDDDTAIIIESPYGAVSLVYVVSNEWRLF